MVTCLVCVASRDDSVAVELDPGVPGASAQREYDRRHARREDQARDKLGVLGVAIARMVEEPASTKAWAKGAKGEKRVGARLTKLLDGTEVKLLHDRRIPGRGAANIDHIAVGPGGVTVIDTKNLKGKVRTDRVGGLLVPRRGVLLVNGRDQTRFVRKMEEQIAVVRRILDEDNALVGVRGALCFADVDGLPVLRHLSVDGIAIDGPKPIARLAGRPGQLSPSSIQELWSILARAFPPA